MDEFGIYFGHVHLNEQVNEALNDTMIEDVPIDEDDIVVNENDNVEVDEMYVSDEDLTNQKC